MKPKMKRFRILLGMIARKTLIAGLFLLLVPFALSASVVNTSGDIVSASGGFVTGGTTRISSTGMGTFAAGTTVAGSAVCLADGTSCSTGAGWRNTSNQVFLANNATNVTVGYVSSTPVLFVENTFGLVGIGTSAPAATLHIVGQSGGDVLRAVGGIGNLGSAGGGINLTGGTGSTGAGPQNGGTGGFLILNAGRGGDAGSSSAGPGGNVSIAAGDGGLGGGSSANGGFINILPGIERNGMGTNGSVVVTRGSVILGTTPEKEGDTSFYRLNVLGNSNLSGNVTITSGGLSIGSVSGARILTTSTATHYTTSGSAHAVYFGHTVYGNVNGESGVYIGPQFQLPSNVGVLVGAFVVPGMQLNIYNITRVETIRIAPFLADTYNGTVVLMEGIRLNAPNVSNGTVTAYAGINQQDVTSATGNTRGIRSQITGGALKHNLYINGTADNYFAGNLSIGAATPTAQLDVNGAEAAANGLLAAIELTNSASGGGTWYLRAGATGTNTPAGGFSIGSTSNTYRLSITSGGLVGINTTSPTSTLHVVGNMNITDVLSIRESEIRQGFSYVNYTAIAISTTSATAYTRLNLSLMLAPNSRYVIDCDLISDAAAATTGVVIGVNLTGSPTSVRATYSSPGTTVAGAISVQTFSGTGTTTNLFSDTDSTTTPYIAKIDGIVVTSSNPVTWHVDLRSEVGGSAVNVREGSFCRASRVG